MDRGTGASAASSGLIVSRDDFDLVIPLAPQFRFAHEPLGTHAGELPDDPSSARFVGRRKELAELGMRLLFSTGGAFLVTGYRGVGKTSFVNQVATEVRRWAAQVEPAIGSALRIVDVRLNLARVMDPVEIMHHIIRGLYRRLEELELLRRLPSDLRQSLELAFQRTSFHISRSTSYAHEGGVDVGGLGWRALTGGLKVKSSRSRTSELEFLSYDDKAAEYDIMNLSRQLSRGYATPWWERVSTRATGGRPYRTSLLKIIFIFDELDKLDNPTSEGAIPPVDSMIGTLKNVFTTSGICFVFIAGRDLEDRWRADLGRGDSLYESVFSYNRYLPPLWDDVGEICDRLVGGGKASPVVAAPPEETAVVLDSTMVYEDFKQYLAFSGRGIPRRILRAFHHFVHWDGLEPYLGFNREDHRRHRFFAELQDLLAEKMPELIGESEQVPTARLDQFRLSIYYLTDWILARRKSLFTLADAVAAARRLSEKVALVEDVAGDVVLRLLSALTEAHYLEKVTDDPDRVRLGDEDEAETQYRLRRERSFQLGAEEDLPADEAKLDVPEPPVLKDRIGKYELRTRLAEGGMGEVWLAWDDALLREVVVKVLQPKYGRDPEIRARFHREARLLATLRHPNVVRLYESGEEDGSLYIVMSHLQGKTLAELLSSGPPPAAVATGIARFAASAYSHVHGHGMVRLDVKPANIMVEPDGSVIVYDFGIARPGGAQDDELTKTGVLIGTPKYMAPEQVMGKRVDGRADIFSLGVVLYEMLAGRHPFSTDEGYMEVLYAIMQQEPATLSETPGVSPQLESAVFRSLEKKPEDRFQSMQEFRDALSVEEQIQERIAAYARGANARRAASGSEIQTDVVARPAATVIEGPAEPVAVEQPALLFLTGSQEGAVRRLAGSMTIGRSRDANIVLDDPQVSRFHASISEVYPTMVMKDTVSLQTEFELTDLGGGSGTYVNGKKIRGTVTLQPGDQIQIGSTKLEFRLPD